MDNTLISEFAYNFDRENKNERIKIHENFRILFDNDYDSICEIISDECIDRILSKATLDKLRFYHIDIVSKYLNRQSLGVVTNPVRLIDNVDYELNEYLGKANYNEQIIETLKRALWFNVCLIQPVYRDNKLALDILTPDMFNVVPTDDLTGIKEILIQKYDQERKEVYYAYWSESEHYLLYGHNKVAVEGNEGMVNPYGILPFAVLKINNENIDFWGEPDWSGYYAQIETDIKESLFNKAEVFQSFNIPIATNLNMAENSVISADTVIKVDNVRQDMQAPDLSFVSPNVDWVNLRNNLSQRITDLYNSKGLSNNSASKDVKVQSGASKEIDELELEEFRNSLRIKMINFEKQLLEIIRIVVNYEKQEIPNGEFVVVYGKNKAKESIQDKKIRYETMISLGAMDVIDVIMQELELDEAKAIEYYKERQIRKQTLGLGQDNRLLSLFNRSQNGTGLGAGLGTTGNDNIQA